MAFSAKDETSLSCPLAESQILQVKRTMIQRKTKPTISQLFNFLIVFVFVSWILYFLRKVQLEYSEDYYYEINEIPIETVTAKIAFEDNFQDYDSVRMEFLNYKLDYHVKKLFNNCTAKKILVMIPSRPSGFDHRMAIRRSWLKYEDSDIIHKFIVGFDSNTWTRRRIDKEAKIYNDLVITNIVDSYKNLSLKTYALLHWQQTYCPDVSYLLKSDDDTVVHLPRLKYFIEKYFNPEVNRNQDLIFGKVWEKVPLRTSPNDKWYTPKFAWKEAFFPNYCNGPTYLLTASAISRVLNETPNSYLISVEDALFTGILAEKAGIKRIDHSRMFSEGINVKSGCTNDFPPQPWIISGYGFFSDSFNFKENVSNPISIATEQLFGLSCN